MNRNRSQFLLLSRRGFHFLVIELLGAALLAGLIAGDGDAPKMKPDPDPFFDDNTGFGA